jgi:uncharacterized circularly permuted ATP-grasp superfamily protein
VQWEQLLRRASCVSAMEEDTETIHELLKQAVNENDVATLEQYISQDPSLYTAQGTIGWSSSVYFTDQIFQPPATKQLHEREFDC